MSTISSKLRYQIALNSVLKTYLIPTTDIGYAFASDPVLLNWWKKFVFDGQSSKIPNRDATSTASNFLTDTKIKERLFDVLSNVICSNSNLPSSYRELKSKSNSVIMEINQFVSGQLKALQKMKGLHTLFMTKIVHSVLPVLPKAIFNKIARKAAGGSVSESELDTLYEDTLYHHPEITEALATVIHEVTGLDFMDDEEDDEEGHEKPKDDTKKSKEDTKQSKTGKN